MNHLRLFVNFILCMAIIVAMTCFGAFLLGDLKDTENWNELQKAKARVQHLEEHFRTKWHNMSWQEIKAMKSPDRDAAIIYKAEEPGVASILPDAPPSSQEYFEAKRRVRVAKWAQMTLVDILKLPYGEREPALRWFAEANPDVKVRNKQESGKIEPASPE